MKNIVYNFLLINILIFVSSCSTSNEVSQNSRLQKRKYNNGYYISSLHKKRKKAIIPNETIENSELITVEKTTKTENTVASIDHNFVTQESSKPKFEIEDNNINIEYQFKKNTSEISSISEFKQDNFSQNKVKWLRNDEIKKIDFKNNIKEKSQKSRKVNDEQLIFILLMVLAFFLPPLSVLLFTNIDWKKVLIATILTCLWWGPGVLYAILVLFEIL
ncbi:MAG: YqaE/Pmp3 family membrane protein [Crocinitomicaceae bacterium]